MFYKKIKYTNYEINAQGKIRFIFTANKYANNGGFLDYVELRTKYLPLDYHLVEYIRKDYSLCRTDTTGRITEEDAIRIIDSLYKGKNIAYVPQWFVNSKIQLETLSLYTLYNKYFNDRDEKSYNLKIRLSNNNRLIEKYQKKINKLDIKINKGKINWIKKRRINKKAKILAKYNNCHDIVIPDLLKKQQQNETETINLKRELSSKIEKMKNNVLNKYPTKDKVQDVNGFISLNEFFIKHREDFSGIYILRNNENGKYYVGQSKHVIQRQKQHWQIQANKLVGCKNPHFCPDFYASKLDIDKRVSIKVIPCDKSRLDELEKSYINQYDSYKNGYNSTAGNNEF